MMLDDDETLGDPERAHLVPSKDNIVRHFSGYSVLQVSCWS